MAGIPVELRFLPHTVAGDDRMHRCGGPAHGKRTRIVQGRGSVSSSRRVRPQAGGALRVREPAIPRHLARTFTWRRSTPLCAAIPLFDRQGVLSPGRAAAFRNRPKAVEGHSPCGAARARLLSLCGVAPAVIRLASGISGRRRGGEIQTILSRPANFSR
jgi:hypothetical protein